MEIGEPRVDDERLELFEKHKTIRGLGAPERPIDRRDYTGFFIDRCAESFELRLLHRGRLACVAVTDRGASSLSAVYCFYDPDLSHLGLGTYAILKQVELCRQWERRHLYLGLYIAENAHMRHKGRFRPHERLINGEWREFP